MLRRIAIAATIFAAAATFAYAQEVRRSTCFALADATPGIQYLHRAAYRDAVPEFTVRITYVTHSTFLIQNSAGQSAATDFTGFLAERDFIPTVVTMNNAHSSHWTPVPDPQIPYVLKGWGEDGQKADHYLDLQSMLIRNITTDRRSGFGGGFVPDGNSVFVFEIDGLCIGHLGHLHQELSEAQYASLGRLDVVMVAVDGGLTLPTESVIRVMKRLRSSVVIPMHWFGRGTLNRFLEGMSGEFDIEHIDGSSTELSLANLPSRPTVRVLRTQIVESFDDDF